jgi:hypothetical protein
MILDTDIHNGITYRVGFVLHGTMDAYLAIESAEGEITETDFDAGGAERYLYLAFLPDDAFAAVVELVNNDPFSSTTYAIHGYSQTDGSVKILPLSDTPIAFGNFAETLWVELANGQTLILGASLEATTLPSLMESTDFRMVYRGHAVVDGEAVANIHLMEPGIYEVSIDSTRGIVRTFTVIISFLSEGLSDGQVFALPVVFYGNGELKLDGEPYISGAVIAQPGYHELTQSGFNRSQSFDFLILPAVSGIQNEGTYDDPLKIRSNAISMMLNGSPYLAGTIILEPGDYVLELICANGYIETLTFVVIPSIRGVVDGMIYQESVTIYVNGVALLDGKSLPNIVTITANGEHEIVLMWEDTVMQTIRFTISAAPETEVETSRVAVVRILIGSMGAVGLFWIFYKKKPQLPK